MKKNNLLLERLIAEKIIFLNYFKSLFPLFHNSNVFFRDIQFTIVRFFDLKGKKLSYSESEFLTEGLVNNLVNEQILKPVHKATWKLNYPLFTTGAPLTYEVLSENKQ